MGYAAFSPARLPLEIQTLIPVLNQPYFFSETRDALVSFSVRFEIEPGDYGVATLRHEGPNGSDFNGITTAMARLTGTADSVVTSSSVLSGIIPAGRYARIATSNFAGSPLIQSLAGQVVLL